MNDEPLNTPRSDAPDRKNEHAASEARDDSESSHHEESGPEFTFRRPNSTTILVAIAVALLAAILAINISSRRGKTDVPATELAKKIAERDALRAGINSERARLGLPAIEGIGSTEDPSQIAARISRDSATLATMLTQFDDVIRDRDAQLAAKTAALLTSEQQRQALTATVAQLQQQLQKALVDSSSSDLLRNQLSAATTRAADLEAKLSDAQSKLGDYANRPPPGDIERLKSQLEEARRARDFYDETNQKLEAELAKLRNNQAVAPPPEPKLFAETDADLLPAAVKLFARLRKLEGSSDSEIMAEYAKLGKDLGATVLKKVSFPTNQSDLTPGDKTAIDALAPNLPNRGLILVIGYASETGNVNLNRKLSSARATKTAEEINAHKLSGQDVQAAYLGQTNRFSGRTPEKNQICEIWHVLPPNP